MNVSEILAAAAERLAESGIPESRLEAAMLLASALGRDRTFLIAHPEYEPSEPETARFAAMLERRANREPYQYIVGKQEFYGLDFEVTPDVLIPRPETEILVEAAIGLLAILKSPRFLEIGVGSGSITVSVLKHIAAARAVGVDIFDNALAVARRNAARQGVAERLELLLSDVYSDVEDQTFDAILSNPPYVPAADIDTLQPEVRAFEPLAALTDGGDGLAIIEQIVSGAPACLVLGGHLLIEFGFSQSESIKRMFDADIWQSVEMIDDLQGIPRIVVARIR